MTAPISDSAVMVRRCPVCSGVSRTMSTSRRRSLSTTSAARVSSVDVTPVAISDMVRIEQGAIKHAVGNERAAGNRGADVLDRVHDVGLGLELLGADRQFVMQGQLRGLAHDQVRFDPGRAQHLQGPHPRTMPEAPLIPTMILRMPTPHITGQAL
jgi:hypothetical protein